MDRIGLVGVSVFVSGLFTIDVFVSGLFTIDVFVSGLFTIDVFVSGLFTIDVFVSGLFTIDVFGWELDKSKFVNEVISFLFTFMDAAILVSIVQLTNVKSEINSLQ